MKNSTNDATNNTRKKTPFSMERLDHLVLRTTDVNRLVNFYCSLGGTVVREIEAMRLVQISAGASMIDVIGTDDVPGDSPGNEGRNLDHFALRVAPFDRDSILAWCEAEGIPAEAPEYLLLGADGFGPAVYIEDPDGNRVELKGPPEQPRRG